MKKEELGQILKPSNRIKSWWIMNLSCKNEINSHAHTVLLHHSLHCSTKGSVLLHKVSFKSKNEKKKIT